VPEKQHYRALTIAGSDSGGGAGIQADLKTFSALGCFGMSAITALTAQNTVAVTAIHEVPSHIVAEQIDAVIDDIGVDAVKIGMLSSPEIIETVADRLIAHNVLRIVLDPVMVAKSGDKLLRDDAIDALKAKLIPIAAVITPNMPEAEVLTGRRLETNGDLEDACENLAQLGSAAVLIKGGHSVSESTDDCLYIQGENGPQVHWLAGTRIDSSNTHGTGCTLSSAIAAHLAKGYGVLDAVRSAKVYTREAIAAGAEYRIGSGHGPVHHFYGLWKDRMETEIEGPK